MTPETSTSEDSVVTFVVGRHVVSITKTDTAAPYSVAIGLELDYERSWVFETAGWQPISYGVHRNTVYWWSASDLVLFPLGTPDLGPVPIKAEDTLHFVFGVDDCWLLICETSIRLLSGDLPVASYEFGEVLLTARWEDDYCVVEGDLGSTFKVRVVDGKLVLGE